MNWDTVFSSLASTVGGVYSAKYNAQADAARFQTQAAQAQSAQAASEANASRSERVLKFAIAATVIGLGVWAMSRKGR